MSNKTNPPAGLNVSTSLYPCDTYEEYANRIIAYGQDAEYDQVIVSQGLNNLEHDLQDVETALIDRGFTLEELPYAIQESKIHLFTYPKGNGKHAGIHVFLKRQTTTADNEIVVWGRIGADIRMDKTLYQMNPSKAVEMALALGSYTLHGDTYLYDDEEGDHGEVDFSYRDKSTFLDAITAAYDGDYKAMHISVSVKGAAPEVITNPRANFLPKRDYYENAYDAHLQLVANPDIRIVGYSFTK